MLNLFARLEALRTRRSSSRPSRLPQEFDVIVGKSACICLRLYTTPHQISEREERPLQERRQRSIPSSNSDLTPRSRPRYPLLLKMSRKEHCYLSSTIRREEEEEDTRESAPCVRSKAKILNERRETHLPNSSFPLDPPAASAGSGVEFFRASSER